MSIRNYSSTTPKVLLAVACDDSITTITLSNTEDVFPAAPFSLILDYGTASEEVVEVTSKNGGANYFTVTRGVDGTSAVPHALNAEVVHGVSAREFSESVYSDDVDQFRVMTAASYASLSPKNARTFYIVTD